MSARRFRVGDTVVNTLSVGGVQRRRIGTVTEVGRGNVRVQFPDLNGPVWLSVGRTLELHEPVDARRELVAVVEVPAAAVVPASTSPGPLNLSALEAQGIDPLALFVALGRDLAARSAAAVDAARAELERAREEERQAEVLLDDARAQVTRARAALASAEAQHAELAARVAA